ncbi:MAG TPA: CHAT domain-containing protein, partial [Streptosporangiaceae bacterium]
MADRGIELEIGRGEGTDTFTVQVLHSSGGRPRGRLDLDVSGILSRRTELENALLASASKVRRAVAPDEDALREIGQQLFEALFAGPVSGAYRASLGAVTSAEGRLRVGLHITAPELAALPWETMFDPVAGRYVCLDEPLVRRVDAPFAPEPLEVRPPVRILGLVAAPNGLANLDVRAEQANLGRALADAEARGLVQLTWAPDASWRTIHDLLLGHPWHVLHFIGHGAFDARGGEGQLILVGPGGNPDYIEASRLAELLSEADPTPRLVVLNACAAGQSGTGDLFSGAAAALVHGGVSAVAAMQFSISDQAAIAFARGFYTAIASGRPVDLAARSGRIDIRGIPTLEWVTPVLYARAGVQDIFRLGSSPAGDLAELSAMAQAHMRAAHDEAAIDVMGRMLSQVPHDSRDEQLLGWARRTLWLTQTYVRARRAEDSGAWSQAVAEYSRIVQSESAYRDAQRRLSYCRDRALIVPQPR